MILHQARNLLGTPGGAKSIFRGAQIFLTMSNNFKLCPTHFSRGDENFSKGASPPWLRACLTLTINHDFGISLHSGITDGGAGVRSCEPSPGKLNVGYKPGPHSGYISVFTVVIFWFSLSCCYFASFEVFPVILCQCRHSHPGSLSFLNFF